MADFMLLHHCHNLVIALQQTLPQAHFFHKVGSYDKWFCTCILINDKSLQIYFFCVKRLAKKDFLKKVERRFGLIYLNLKKSIILSKKTFMYTIK